MSWIPHRHITAIKHLFSRCMCERRESAHLGELTRPLPPQTPFQHALGGCELCQLDGAHQDILINHMMQSSLIRTMSFTSFAVVILTAQTAALSHLNEKRLGVRLGNEVMIPCADHHEVNHQDVTWFYSENSQGKRDMIVHTDKTGLQHKSSNLWGEKKILYNFSLVIMNFKEADEGTYSCETCAGEGKCTKGLHTSLFLIKELPPAVTKRLYSAEGGNFSHSCLGVADSSGPSVSWTFQRFGEMSSIPWPHQRGEPQPNASILIRDIQTSDAGVYSCWRNRRSDQQQKLLSLSLCVLTARPGGSSLGSGSLLNCYVHCDLSWESFDLPQVPGKSSTAAAAVVEDGAVTFHLSEHERTVVCHAKNNQEDENANPQMLLLCVALASSFCVLALFLGLVFLYRRVMTEFPPANEPPGDVVCPTRTRDVKPQTGEEESQIIYSVLEMKQPETDRGLGQEGCVYSTIQYI